MIIFELESGVKTKTFRPISNDFSLYKVCGVMQHRVYQTEVKDLDDLKRRLIDVWAGIQQSLIDDAINQWRKRLRACVRAKGGCVGSVSARSLQTEPTARLWVRVRSTDVYRVISLGKIFTPTRLG